VRGALGRQDAWSLQAIWRIEIIDVFTVNRLFGKAAAAASIR